MDSAFLTKYLPEKNGKRFAPPGIIISSPRTRRKETNTLYHEVHEGNEVKPEGAGRLTGFRLYPKIIFTTESARRAQRKTRSANYLSLCSFCVVWTKTAVLNGFLIPGIEPECIPDLF